MLDVGIAGAVLVVTAEGRCIIKVFPAEEEAEGSDAIDGQPSSAQVLHCRVPASGQLPVLVRAVCTR